MPARNVAFEMVYNEKQWTTARDKTGLKGRLTEKVNMGKEFAIFHRTREVNAAQNLIGKLGIYSGILRTKHANDSYFKPLQKIVEDQKKLLATGIRLAAAPDQNDLFAEALQRAVQTGDRAAAALTELARKRLFSDHRQRHNETLGAISDEAVAAADALGGNPGPVAGRAAAAVVNLEKRLQTALAEIDQDRQTLLNTKKTAGEIERYSGAALDTVSQKAQTRQARLDLTKRLTDVRDEATQLYNAMGSVPGASQNTLDRVRAIEEAFAAAQTALAAEDQAKWDDADDHWRDVMAPMITAHVDTALAKKKDVVLGVHMDELINGLFEPVRQAHAQQWDRAVVEYLDKGHHGVDVLTKSWILMIDQTIAEAIQGVSQSQQSTHFFDYVPPAAAREAGPRVKKQKFEVARPEKDDDRKATESLCNRIGAANSPVAVGKLLQTNETYMKGVFPQRPKVVANLKLIGSELENGSVDIGLRLGANPPELRVASKRLAKMVEVVWPLCDQLPGPSAVKKALKNAVFVPLSENIKAHDA